MNATRFGEHTEDKVDSRVDELFFQLENRYETKYADISNGEKIGYREVGEGTTILFLHGNFTCSNVFEPIMEKLSQHLRCIAPCLRGFGYTSLTNPMSSLKDLATDIKLFVTEHLKIDKFYVIGHQLGGCIGVELAHMMPENVEGVLNFAMFPISGLKVPGFKIETMEDIQALPEYKGFRNMMVNQDLVYYKDGFSQLVNVSGIVDEYALRQLAIMNRQRNFWPVCLAVHNFNFEDKLNDLKMPLKFIYGMKDKVCPLESGLEWKERAQGKTNIKVTGFPQARHFPIEEQEKNSIEHILEFIGNGKTMMKRANA